MNFGRRRPPMNIAQAGGRDVRNWAADNGIEVKDEPGPKLVKRVGTLIGTIQMEGKGAAKLREQVRQG